jgi:hypothetical protein
MPPMSVLSAPPPPGPGGPPEPPAVPGAVPRLSMALPGHAAPPPPPGKPSLHIKVAADGPGKIGGKPIVKPGKPGKAPKPAAVLGKRSALGPIAKAGIGVLAVAVVVGGIFSYRIFFPAPSHDLPIKAPIVKPVATVVASAAKAVDNGQNAIASRRNAEQAKVDAALAGDDAATPTPTPTQVASESVMAQTNVTADVKVDTTHLDAAPAASAAFRTFVANASIGGVFQGEHSRALINGSIVREGQVVDSTLGISFEKVDADKKTIFFKDSTGAEVSKNY